MDVPITQLPTQASVLAFFLSGHPQVLARGHRIIMISSQKVSRVAIDL